MIRARMGPTALLGLTDVNVSRLTADQPIRVKLAEVSPEGAGPPQEVIIFHANRESIAHLAETTGTDPDLLFSQLGEDELGHRAAARADVRVALEQLLAAATAFRDPPKGQEFRVVVALDTALARAKKTLELDRERLGG